MRDERKTKAQLIDELKELHKQIAGLRKAYDELEQRVEERSRELSLANQALSKEIEEHKKADEELRKSEEHLRSLMENASSFAIYRLLRDRKKPDGFSVVFVSPSISDIIGISDPMKFDTWLENIDPNDLKRITEASVQAGKTSKLNETIRIYHPQKQEWRWIQAVSTAAPGKKGELRYVNGIIIDITERRRAAEAAREQTLRNELILQTAMDGFFILNMKGKIVKANPAAQKILGYSPKKLTTMSVGDLEPEEAARNTAKHLRRVAKKGSNRFETKYRRKDGRIVDVEVTTNFLDIGEEGFFFSFFHDITSKNQAYHELKEREEELGAKSSALEEVNTTLKVLFKAREEDKKELETRVILNVNRMVVPFVQKLKESGLGGKQKAYLSVIESNLADIISSFLSTLSAKYSSLTPSETRIANLIKEGRSTKEIGVLLNLSHRTVESHREGIRKKLGLTRKKSNLRTCLLSLQ